MRPRTGQAPTAGKPRANRDDDPFDLDALPEADRTKENRGAVGIKHNKGGSHEPRGSLTTNEASGTIGGDTPPPIFDRAAIAAGQKGALVGGRGSGKNPDGSLGASGVGPNAAARGTPKPGVFGDKLSPERLHTPRPKLVTPAPVIVDDSINEAIGDDEASDADGEPIGADDSGVIVHDDSSAQLAVPVGEFDQDHEIVEQDNPRAAYAQATIKRDAASALLGLAEPARAVRQSPPAGVMAQATAMRGDATDDAPFHNSPVSSTGRFDHGDPTLGEARGDETALSAPSSSHAPTGTLRSSAALPRQRGIAGDLRYVATVVFGVRKANRELAALQAKQATRQQSRRHHLVILGRTAVTRSEWIDSGAQRGKGKDQPVTEPDEGAEHPALGPARAQLSTVENERSQHAEHVSAADAELTRVRLDREAKAKQYAADLAALDAELLALAKKLEPLEKEAIKIKRRAADLRDALRRIDGKIASTEASLTSVKGGKLDRAEVQAELATLKAERKAIQSDEPVIAGQLDGLSPRIAALEAARGEAQRKRAELETTEQNDQRRVEEMLVAIGAKRKVVDRAASDAEALRDKILFQLGEQLYVDRPDHLIGQLAPIDEIDVELGLADRQAMELREILSSVDKLKVARGIALIVLILGAIGALTGWLLHLFP